MIPKDWNEYLMQDVAEVTRLAGYEYTEYWEESTQGDILALKGENIGINKLIHKNLAYISNELSNKLIRSKLFKGDIVYPCVGTIGNAFVVKEDNKYHINQNIAKITPNQKLIDSNFLAQYLMSDICKAEIRRFNATSSQPNILVGSLRNYKLLVPTITEQIKIAEILSTYDGAIEKLSQLILSKEKIKKGLMQNLLSGEIRFKEFPEEDYIEGNLSEFVDLRHGYQFRKEDFVKEGVPVIKIGNVTGYELDLNDLTFIEGNRLEEFKDVIISDGDLLMSLTGNIGRVVEVSNMTKPMLQNYRVGKFIPLDESQLSKRYLKHLLSSPIVTRQFLNMSNQSAQANFGKQDMDKIFITFPKNINEQRKISDTITESENEIRNLNLQLEKIKFQKKGLMQQLLTGKIRV